jgi:hypothetical protein
VGDGRAEGALRRARRIDVDPLSVVDRVRELADPLLGDLEPLGRADGATCEIAQPVDGNDSRQRPAPQRTTVAAQV